MKKPDLDEVRAYWTASTLAGAPEEFYDHFEANGWIVGRVPMKNWQAAARNWGRNEAKFGGQTGHAQHRPQPSVDPTQEAALAEIEEAKRLRRERGLD